MYDCYQSVSINPLSPRVYSSKEHWLLGCNKQVVALDFQSLFFARNSDLILEHKAYMLGGPLEV